MMIHDLQINSKAASDPDGIILVSKKEGEPRCSSGRRAQISRLIPECNTTEIHGVHRRCFVVGDEQVLTFLHPHRFCVVFVLVHIHVDRHKECAATMTHMPSLAIRRNSVRRDALV